MASLTEGTADLYKTSLLAAHDKLHLYLNTPEPPTPPDSPSYFSDDAAEMQEQPTKYPGPETILTSEETISESHISTRPSSATPKLKQREELHASQLGPTTNIRIGQFVITTGNTFQPVADPHAEVTGLKRLEKYGYEGAKYKQDPDTQKIGLNLSVMVGQISVLHIDQVQTCRIHQEGVPILTNLSAPTNPQKVSFIPQINPTQQCKQITPSYTHTISTENCTITPQTSNTQLHPIGHAQTGAR